jgi:hypothetical protein
MASEASLAAPALDRPTREAGVSREIHRTLAQQHMRRREGRRGKLNHDYLIVQNFDFP